MQDSSHFFKEAPPAKGGGKGFLEEALALINDLVPRFWGKLNIRNIQYKNTFFWYSFLSRGWAASS